GGKPIGREPEAEPVPVSETPPGAEPPRPEPEGDAVPPAQAPEPALATPLEAGPTAPAPADASPPAEPRSLLTPHSALRDPESERALVDSLVARWRAHRAAPAPHEPSPAERAGYEEMPVAQKPPGLVRRFLTVYRHATGLVYGAAVAVARDREQFPWVRGFALFL